MEGRNGSVATGARTMRGCSSAHGRPAALWATLGAVLLLAFAMNIDIRFGAQTGGRANSGNFMIDNRRLIEEFALQYKPLRQRVKEVINDIRISEGRPLVS